MQLQRRLGSKWLGAVFLLALSSTSCRQPTAGEALISRIKSVPPAAGSGECHFDFTGDKEVAVFRTLGMLDEYLGRQITEDSDVVEHFYESEPQAVGAFRRVTTQLAAEQQLQAPTVDQTAGHTYFRSPPLADRLNSCYEYRMTNDALVEGPNGVMLRLARGTLPGVLFRRSGEVRMDPAGGISDNVLYRRCALAYLSGAWRRSQGGADFVFANSQKKAALVSELLHDLGARGVTVESTVGLIPQTNVVHFTPSPLIVEWLGQAW